MMLSKKHKEAFKVSVKSEFQQQQQQRKGKIFWEILILSVCLFTACTDKLFNKKNYCIENPNFHDLNTFNVTTYFAVQYF